MNEDQKTALDNEESAASPIHGPSQYSGSNPIDLNDIYPSPNDGKVAINNAPQNQIEPANNGVNVKTKNGKSKKTFVILAACMIVLAVISAIIFVPKLLGPSKQEMQKALNRFEEMDLTFALNACEHVRNDVDSTIIKVDLYEEEVNHCKENVISLYNHIDELNLANNTEIQEAFNDFKTSLDTNMPSLSQLDNTLEMYTAMHRFNVALHNFQYASNATEEKEELIDATNYFINSSNNELAQFGNGLKQAFDEMYDTWDNFINEHNERGENYPSNYEKYENAKNYFRDYAKKQ